MNMATSQMQYMLSDRYITAAYIITMWDELKNSDFTPAKHNLPWKCMEMVSPCYMVTVEVPFDSKMKPRWVSCVQVDPKECGKMYQSLSECLVESAHGEASDPIIIPGRKDTTNSSDEMIIPAGSGTPLGTPMVGGMIAQ